MTKKESATEGERTRRLLREREDLVSRGVRTVMPIFVASAKGHVVRDVEGREFLDLTGGIGVHTTGHLPDEVVAAGKEQLDRYGHLCAMVANYEPYLALARRMREVVGIPGAKSVFLNSGSEALENAVKIARAHTGRPGVLSFHDAFHGRTYMALSLTGRVHPYKVGFGPFMPEVYHAPFANCYRCPLSLKYPDCGVACLELVEDVLQTQTSPDRLAALVMEPVQGEGGFVVPPKEFVQGLRRLCDDHGIVFVDDEVQAGLGRTGRWLAIEHFGVRPDLVTTAKALGAGFPISGVTGQPDIMDAPVPGSLGGTYGGHPVGCAMALANLELIERLLPRVPELEAVLRKRLEEMMEAHDLVGDVRGLGAMMALEFVRDRETKEPAVEEAAQVQEAARRRGVLFLTAGRYGNVLRLHPPLAIPPDALEHGLQVLDEAIGVVEKEREGRP